MGLGDDDLVYIEEYRAALVIVDNMLVTENEVFGDCQNRYNNRVIYDLC